MAKHVSDGTKQTKSGTRAVPVDDEVPTLAEDRIAALRSIMPEVFAETGIDFDKLKMALGGAVDEGKERYGLTWSGKAQSVRQLMLPARGTLVPDRDESVNFDTTQHVFIEGENLEVLKLLRKAYAGRVKMIYIDPPYNTGKDFIYPDNFSDPLGDYLTKTGQVDEEGNWTSSVTESDGRKHSKWLSMIYPRLLAAKDLLRDDGVIFVSIDDHEVHNLRMVMSEVFGEENFVGMIVAQLNPRGRHLDQYLAKTHEYVMVVARDVEAAGISEIEKDERMLADYDKEDGGGKYRELELRNRNPLFNKKTRKNLYYPLYVNPTTGTVRITQDREHKQEVFPDNKERGDSCWTWSPSKSKKDGALLLGRQTREGKWRVYRKDYLYKADGSAATTLPKSIWIDAELNMDQGKKAVKTLFGENVFDFPKPVGLIRKLVDLAAEDGDLVLDFFAGSGTAAEAVLDANVEDGTQRRFVLVQANQPTAEGSSGRKAGYRDIADIASDRIRLKLEAMEKEAKDSLVNAKDERVTDVGLRYFRITESHYKRWVGVTEADAKKYVETMALYTDPLLPGWTPEGLLWEVALKAGYPLHSTVETSQPIKGQTVYRVTDPDKGTTFHACFDKTIKDGLAGVLKLTRDDMLVVRDAALTDTQAANLALTCTLRTI